MNNDIIVFSLTVIGSEDRIFISSSAKDPEANGAIPNSASEKEKRNEQGISNCSSWRESDTNNKPVVKQ